MWSKVKFHIEKAVGYQKYWTHWQWYRKIFNISIFRYLVTWFSIVPIIYSFVERINEKLNIFDINHILKIPISWQLLWASSLTFIIAYLLYLWKCPRFIKEYHSYAEYKKHMHSPRWLVWLSEEIIKNDFGTSLYIERMVKKKYFKKLNKKIDNAIQIEVLEKVTQLTFKYNDNVYIFEMPIIVNDKEDEKLTTIAEREIFWEIFGRFSSAHKIIRLKINILLLISGISFSIVFIQNIIKGFSLVLKYFI